MKDISSTRRTSKSS